MHIPIETVRAVPAMNLDAVNQLIEDISPKPVDPYMDHSVSPSFWVACTVPPVAGLEVVGYSSIYGFDPVSQRCRADVWVHPAVENAQEVVRALVSQRDRHLINVLNVRRIEWAVPAEDDQRIKAAVSLGYHSEGLLREAVYYDGKYHDITLLALLRSDLDLARNRVM